MILDNSFCECGCGLQTLIYREKPRRFVSGHNSRSKKNRGLKLGITKNAAGYIFKQKPEHQRSSSWGYVREHVLIAEKALGKPLPNKAVVHHHTPIQLVVCQDQAYHMIIHLRTRAFEACGNAHYRKCQFCQKWDDPQKLYITPNKKRAYHKSCRNKYLKDKEAS